MYEEDIQTERQTDRLDCVICECRESQCHGVYVH